MVTALLVIFAIIIVVAIVGLIFLNKRKQALDETPTIPNLNTTRTAPASPPRVSEPVISDGLSEIEQLIKTQRYDDANNKLKHILLNNPKNSGAMLLLLQVYAYTNNQGAFDKLYTKLQATGDHELLAKAESYRAIIANSSAIANAPSAPEAPALTPAPTSALEEVEPMLDFDELMLDTPASEVNNTATSNNASADSADLDFGLDDFGLETPTPEPAQPSTSNDSLQLDSFDLDFGTPSPAPAKEDAGSLELGALEGLDGLDFGSESKSTTLNADLGTDLNADFGSLNELDDFGLNDLSNTNSSSNANNLDNFDDLASFNLETTTPSTQNELDSFNLDELGSFDEVLPADNNKTDSFEADDFSLDAFNTSGTTATASIDNEFGLDDTFSLNTSNEAGGLEADIQVTAPTPTPASTDFDSFDFDLGGTTQTSTPSDTLDSFASKNNDDSASSEFDLPEFGLDDFASSQGAAPSPVASTVEVASDDGFDFDLGNFGDAATETVAPTTTSSPSLDVPASDDFSDSFSLDDFTTKTEAPLADNTIIEPTDALSFETPKADLDNTDFGQVDFGLDNSTTDITNTPDADAFEFDVGIADVGAPEVIDTASVDTPEMDAFSPDNFATNQTSAPTPTSEFDFLATPPASPVAPAPSSAPSLDTPTSDIIAPSVVAAAATVASSMTNTPSMQADATHITLDLAQQYLTLGEYDSAKHLLQEVVQLGSAEQRHTASTLLKRLG